MKSTKCKDCIASQRANEFMDEGIEAGFTLSQIHFLAKNFVTKI